MNITLVRMRMKMIDRVKYIIYILLGGYSVYWLLQVTTCCSFHAPTESMTPTILPGDKGIVNKWKLGARIFDINKAINGEKVQVYRLSGYGTIERNDIVVFNYPLIGKDTVGINMRKYYCKRIVAIPGDTMEIRNCKYLVHGVEEALGYVPAQIELNQRILNMLNPNDGICFYTWPYDTVMGWNVKNFGPLVIPRKGLRIMMTRENTMLYGRYIAWEQQTSLPIWKRDRAEINGKLMREYTFNENYYFAAGDRVENSADSRYWGLLPEVMIVGVANFIWDSKEPKTGDRRWNRIFTSLTNNNCL